MSRFGWDKRVCLHCGRVRAVGDVLWEKFNELGPTYRPNVLWEFGVLTCDPAIIKVNFLDGGPYNLNPMFMCR